MFEEERQIRIMNELTEHRSMSVADLARILNVSGSTIRRDLTSMEQNGLIRRTHGGAMIVEEVAENLSYDRRSSRDSDLKEKIAAAAAGLIRDGETILLNSSSVTSLMPRYMTARNLTVITNSIRIAQELKTRLCSIDGILGAYDLVLHNYGPTRAMGSVNVAVYDWHTAADLHALSKKAQALIWEEYRIYLYIGFYAVNTHDDALRVLEDQVRGECKAYPEVLSIHAFFENQETGTISFDAVVDFACRDSLALIHRMEEELAAKHPGRRFAIKIDRAYSD